jgi:hypothetical protein
MPLPADLVGERALRAAARWLDDRRRHLDSGYVGAAEHRGGRHHGGRIPGEEATVKTFRTERNKVVLVPSNPRMEPMVFEPGDVTIYGRVVTVLRSL